MTVQLNRSSLLFDAIADPVTNRLSLVGEVDSAGTQQFRNASRKLLAGDPGEVVIDLARLRFMDAAGVGLLVELRNELAVRGATLLILNAGNRIVRVFSLCGLNRMLDRPG